MSRTAKRIHGQRLDVNCCLLVFPLNIKKVNFILVLMTSKRSSSGWVPYHDASTQWDPCSFALTSQSVSLTPNSTQNLPRTELNYTPANFNNRHQVSLHPSWLTSQVLMTRNKNTEKSWSILLNIVLKETVTVKYLFTNNNWSNKSSIEILNSIWVGMVRPRQTVSIVFWWSSTLWNLPDVLVHASWMYGVVRQLVASCAILVIWAFILFP